MKYSAEHGEYEVAKSQQTVLLSARGPWNDETLYRGTRETAQVIQQLDFSKPWGGLSCLYGESLLPPSAYKTFEKQTLQRKRLGMTGLAIVILDSSITTTIIRQLSKAYEIAQLEHDFVSNIEHAMQWLEQKGVLFDATEAKQFFEKNSFVSNDYN